MKKKFWPFIYVCLVSWTVPSEAATVPSGQDVGSTTRLEQTSKEQKTMIKKLSRKRKKVEVEGEENLQRVHEYVRK